MEMVALLVLSKQGKESKAHQTKISLKFLLEYTNLCQKIIFNSCSA